MNALLKFVSHYWHHEPEPEAKAPETVGEFKADYSLLTAQELAQTDAECEALFKNSRPVRSYDFLFG